MKLIITVLIQIVFLMTIHSQHLIRETKNNSLSIHKFDYSYNDQDQLVERIFSTYYKEEKVNEQRTKVEWEYSNNRVVLKKEYNVVEGEWNLRHAIEINYNEAGCITHQFQKFYVYPDEIIEGTISMVNDYDCSNPWNHHPDHSFLPDSPVETVLTRIRTDSSEIEIYDEKSDFTGEWTRKGIVERKYNDKGKILEKFNSLISYGYAQKYIYTYDDTGEILKSTEFYHKDKIDGEWLKRHREEYLYSESLLREITTIFSPEQSNKAILEYYCDGLLKRNRTLVRGEFARTISYEYDHKIDASQTCEQLESLNLEVYPNPIEDVFYVESDIFQKESSELLVYNAMGSLLFKQTIKERVPNIQVQLDPAIYSNQMLIINLISEDGLSISKKVMVGK